MDHPLNRPTYEEHIKDLFTSGDAGCMSWALDLTTYEGVKNGAPKISEWIGSGRMPPPDTGRQWSAERLQTFRNWAGNTGYAEQSFVRIAPSEEPRVRKNLHEIEKGSEDHRLLVLAFEGIMKRDADLDDPTSFYNLAGLHWLPGPISQTFCRHHDDAYNPWHRAYLMAFEDALRSVEGCENVTLPYWDILGADLPDWLYEAPFFHYSMPHDLEGLDGTVAVNAGYKTERNSAADIAQKIRDRKSSIEMKIGEALASDSWRGFNGWSDFPANHEGIIRAHDNGHDVCGDTIGSQAIAAFDPLFWFFHCNWDRIWWKWQKNKNKTSLLSFREAVSGDKHWLEEAPDNLLAPFDANSAEMINLAGWNVDYEDPPEAPISFDDLLLASRGHIRAERSFQIPTLEKYSVRVKDINRLEIPGSFDVVLLSGENILDRTHIFQPTSPSECENCRKHGVFSTDFVIAHDAVMSKDDLRVAIFIKNGVGEVEEFPISKAGNPTVNFRLLLNEQ